MMKLIQIIFILFCLNECCSCQGGWTRPNVSYGTIQYRGSFEKAILLPTKCGIPDSLDAYDLHQFAFKGDSCGHIMYYYDPSLQAWSPLGSSTNTSATILDSTILTIDGYHPTIIIPLTRTGFKNIEIAAESDAATGFQQSFNALQAVLEWQSSKRGMFKFYITYYY